MKALERSLAMVVNPALVAAVAAMLVQMSLACAGPGLVPYIDRNRCEGKAVCVDVCPYDVFVLREIAAEERAALSLRGRLKAWVHGGLQAEVAHADRCHGCGLCVLECPEQAITLVPAPA